MNKTPGQVRPSVMDEVGRNRRSEHIWPPGAADEKTALPRPVVRPPLDVNNTRSEAPRPTRPLLVHTSSKFDLVPRPSSYIERGGRERTSEPANSKRVGHSDPLLNLTPEECANGLEHLATLRAEWRRIRDNGNTSRRNEDA